MPKEININKRKAYGSSKDKSITYTERENLINNLENTRDRVILIAGAYAGMRQGEIVQCRLDWLEWQNYNNIKILAINIPDETRDLKNKLKLWRPKTKRPRTTYIFDSMLAREFYNFFKDNPKGINLCERNLSEYRVKIIMGNMIGRKISSHCLRAGATNYLIKEIGLDVGDASTILGHRDERTTLDHYKGLSKSNTEANINKILNSKYNKQ